MKKYIVIILLLGFGVAFQSCEDQLSVERFDAIETENALQQPSDFTNAIRGVYSRFRETTYWGGWYQITPDLLADNLILCSEGRNSKQSLHYWTYGGNLTWSGLWDNGYIVALRANAILENIDALEDGAFKTNIMGEALALRAIAHFDMARVYIKFPQHAGAEDMGIPYMTSTDPLQKPSRPGVQETWSNIENDLVDAVAMINGDNGTGRLNKASVQGILSRLYLYTNQFDKAATSATAAIDGGAEVGTMENFPMIWTDETNEGVTFKVLILDADNIAIGVEYSQTGATGVRSEYVADYALYTMYSDDDVRKATYFSTSEFAGKLFNHIAKYFGRPTGDANVTDAKLLRGAEVYLNRAEAYANSGNDAAALADLDALRSQRYANFTSGNETGQALKDAIALERRLELAFEGHRFFDLKRKGLGITRSNFGDEADGGGVKLPPSALEMPAGDNRFQMPIPQDEINANNNMVQNPGY